MSRWTAVALAGALTLGGCFWWRDDDDGQVEGPFSDPRALCQDAVRQLGLRSLRPWQSRVPGHYDCVVTTPGFGAAAGPMRSYVALHVHGRAPESALEIAVQANIVHPGDEDLAFATLDRVAGLAFEHVGTVVPAQLQDAMRTRRPLRLRLADWGVEWDAVPIGRSATSWTLRLGDSGGT